MAGERIEAQFTVPASTSISVSSGALIAATTVTATAATYYPTTFASHWQTAINAAVSPYPDSAAATASAIGWGTWSAGWSFQIASGNDTGMFGGVTLTVSDAPTYSTAGPGTGGDLAITLAEPDLLTGGDNFDATGTDDLIVAWVGRVSSTSSFNHIVGKGTAGDAQHWSVYSQSSLMRFRITNASTPVDIDASFTLADTWYVGIACIDRAAGKARVGTRAVSSGTSAVSTNTTAAALDHSNATNLLVGKSEGFGAQGGTQDLAALYIGAGSGVAAGLPANLSTALTNFANAVNSSFTVSLSTTTGLTTISNSFWTCGVTWTSTAARDLLGFTGNVSGSASHTGTAQHKGLFIPGCPLVSDSDPLQAPRGDDGRATVGPDGTVYGTASTLYYRARNVRFTHVAQSKVWINSGSVTNADWETFYLETQRGQHSWFSPFARLKVYWDNAGTVTELGSGDVAGWKMPKPTKLDDLRLSVDRWTGLVEINLGDLYTAS